MNCPNCGAVMALNPKGLFVCAHCGTSALPQAVERDGIRVVGQSDSGLSCALCKAPFARGLVDEYQVDYCEKCHGILVNRQDFAEWVRRSRAWAETASVMPTPAKPAELRRKIDCPRCGTRMITDWYYGPGSVIIDRCVNCDLIWLDYGELNQIIDAPGPDRGSRELF